MFWFNRMVEHWVAPQRIDLVEHVRRARLQLVQTGTFGPQFYGLADDPQVPRFFPGMPLVGVRANLDYMAELIPRLQDAGARVVGQMSMSWHYGDHEEGRGLFGTWERIWDEELSGTPPCRDLAATQQQVPGGALRYWPIAGRPYRTYSGCMCNPYWLAMLKAMLARAIKLGVDGINVHHNFENLCACEYCRDELDPFLTARFAEAELQELFGRTELTKLEVIAPQETCSPPLRQRFELELQRIAQQRRKEAFDEVFVRHGRALKPDLLLAQWYHKYNFKARDERSLLPSPVWARDEDFIWYSQGSHKGISSLRHGYLADTGLPARFVYAAGGGRPFVINKYDYRRWRLSIAEAAANHAAAPACHWNQDEDESFAREEYSAPVLRYQRFLADQERLIHPARPHSQIGLVYPRRAEVEGESTCTDALRRLGRLLEDAHFLFDMVLDEQLVEERLAHYSMLILPAIARLSEHEIAVLCAFAERGGQLLCSGASGELLPDGSTRAENPLRSSATWIGEVPSAPQNVEIRPGMEVAVYPQLADDAFGREFVEQVATLLGGNCLETDAPWYVRVRAWLPTAESALVLHWVNYRQDEEAQIEVPWPLGPLRVRCAVPTGRTVDRVEWLYPEMEKAATLSHREDEAQMEFTIPQLIVYGMSVIYWR